MLKAALFASTAMVSLGQPVNVPTMATPWPLGTKTPYWGKARTYIPPSSNGQTCKPIMMQHVGRHGSRYTDAEDFDDFAKLMKDYGHAINKDSLKFLRNYENPFPRNRFDQLVDTGREELYGMGSRMFDEFNTDLNFGEYNPAEVKFQHTYKTRTGSSASAFSLAAVQQASGTGKLGPNDLEAVHMAVVWNGNTDWNDDLTISDGDKVLRPTDNCAGYEVLVNGNDDHPANTYEDIFEDANITAEVVPRVVDALQWNETVKEMTHKDVKLFYKVCQYESIILKKYTNNACDVFSNDDFAMYAFLKDMSEYHETGYGSSYYDRLACPLFSEMISEISGRVAGDNAIRANFRFGHSDTIMPMVTALGLFKDGVNPTPDMAWTEAEKRQWKTSEIAPMGANINLILHECTDDTTNATSHKVGLRHNEYHIKWPRCGTATDVDFCSVADIKQAYPYSTGCNYDEICKKPVTPAPAPVPQQPAPMELSGSASALSASLVLVALLSAFTVL
eukprot:TRINITY_DN1105_c0_g1_i1.p1 TRINITY_DN1105_c0_g1~~TRINITY_DN1105_c0_g1_i1.p1  ORF type:complete len:505 (+),score=159.54 TRINITY_DN1105_c0_g1_i1:66-1580(+)